jgi:hypothetical protein
MKDKPMPKFAVNDKVVVVNTNRVYLVRAAVERPDSGSNAYSLDNGSNYWEFELRALEEGEEPKPYYKTC